MKIENLDELKKLASSEHTCEAYIRLGFGGRSSKVIKYNESNDTWYIIHEIDGSETICKTDELAKETNIIEALEKGALYLYE